MGYNLLINGVYGGYNPLTNLLLTSWDILVYYHILLLIVQKSQTTVRDGVRTDRT